MLTLKVNGVIYERAINVRVRRSLQQFCGTFVAQCSVSPDQVLPFKANVPVEIFGDGEPSFNGYIEEIVPSYSGEDHTITINGRDRTADFFDSTVSGAKSFQGPISFIALLRRLLDAGNMQNIGIINEAGSIDDFTEEDFLEAEVGQTIYDFIEPYARKRQLVLTTSNNGDILLARASKKSLGITLKLGENILRGSLSKKFNERFNKYIAKSQLNPMGSEEEPSQIVDQTGETTIDAAIRSSRILEFNSEEDMSDEESFNRALFEENIRRANSIVYSCSIKGHSFNGNLFNINRLTFVDDPFCGVSSNLLVRSVEYEYNVNTGSITNFELVTPEAYTLQGQKAARDANRQLIGGGL